MLDFGQYFPSFQVKIPTSAENIAILAGGSLATIILTSRYGILRAVGLALRSRFRKQHPISVRTTEIEVLQNFISCRHPKSYLVLILSGPRGVGKTCLLDTFTSKMCGVVECLIPPGTKQTVIVDKALSAISRDCLPFINLEARARSIIYFYKLLTDKSPFVVIRASESTSTDLARYSPLPTSAFRTLTEKYGVHVIVDSSMNVMDSIIRRDFRAHEVEQMVVEQMEENVFWAIPELEDLFEDLEEIGLKKVAWSVFGSFPSIYTNIRAQFKAMADRDRRGRLTWTAKTALRNIVLMELDLEIRKAVDTVRKAETDHPQMKMILNLLDKKTLQVPTETLYANNLLYPDPNEVLRKSRNKDRPDIFLTPANQAIGFVIRHNLREPQPLEKIMELVMPAASK